MARWGAVLVSGLLTLLFAPVAANAAPVRATTLHCGDGGRVDIDEPGTYRLADDLTCNLNIEGSRWTSPAVIKFGHHVLTGEVDGAPGGTVVISDGSVTGSVRFFAGVLTPTELKHVSVSGNVFANELTLRHSTIGGQVGSAGSLTVHNSVVMGSFWTDDGGTAGTVFDVRRSVFNGGFAALGGFGAPDFTGVIADNRFAGGFGLELDDDLGGLVIEHNVVTGSSGDGISITLDGQDNRNSHGAHSSFTISDNHAVGNAGHGINVQVIAPDTYTDGGGNRANANATDPQCVGVVCPRTRRLPPVSSPLKQ